jgi:hypothetical protein
MDSLELLWSSFRMVYDVMKAENIRLSSALTHQYDIALDDDDDDGVHYSLSSTSDHMLCASKFYLLG